MVTNYNQHLRSAPITEAVVDIKIKQLSDEESEALKKLAETLTEEFPVSKEIKHQEFRLNVDKDGNFADHNQSVDIQGVRLETEDGRKVIQLRKDGFTFSQLKPYTDWKDISFQAQRVFSLYAQYFAKKTSITRLALRYINHIDLPIPCEFSEYLTAPPKVPENLPQELLSFLTQNIIQCNEEGAIARIVQTLNGVKEDKTVSVLLDIDVIKELEDFLELNDPLIWETFEKLRVLKNNIFFESITAKTEELLV